MLQILEMTEAKLATLTSRVEMHGDDEKPAVSLGLEITTGNAILDVLDLALRPALYKAPDSKSLPGIDEALTVLRCNSIERVSLPLKHEGWTLAVDDGIDDTKPKTFGSCKVDKISVEPKQGGRMRIGTSDLDDRAAGMLWRHLGQSIWITLTAPKPGEDHKDEPAPKGKKPDATDLFVESAKMFVEGVKTDDLVNGGKLSQTAAWPFPTGSKEQVDAARFTDANGAAPPAHLVEGMTKGETKAERAAAKKAATKAPMKYRDAATGETWSGRGVMPRWLKVGLERTGKTLSDYEVAKAH